MDLKLTLLALILKMADKLLRKILISEAKKSNEDGRSTKISEKSKQPFTLINELAGNNEFEQFKARFLLKREFSAAECKKWKKRVNPAPPSKGPGPKEFPGFNPHPSLHKE